MTKHTPTPDGSQGYDHEIQRDEADANAAFIVHAVNVHDTMMLALLEAEAIMSAVEPRSDKSEYLRVLGVVRAALAKAEAGE